jgi:hypothetical protein
MAANTEFAKLLACIFSKEELLEIMEQFKDEEDSKNIIISKYIKLHKKKRVLEKKESPPSEETVIRRMMMAVSSEELIIRTANLKEKVDQLLSENLISQAIQYFEKNIRNQTEERREYLKTNGHKLYDLIYKITTCPQFGNADLSDLQITQIIKTLTEDTFDETYIEELVDLWKLSCFI